MLNGLKTSKNIRPAIEIINFTGHLMPAVASKICNGI